MTVNVYRTGQHYLLYELYVKASSININNLNYNIGIPIKNNMVISIIIGYNLENYLYKRPKLINQLMRYYWNIGTLSVNILNEELIEPIKGLLVSDKNLVNSFNISEETFSKIMKAVEFSSEADCLCTSYPDNIRFIKDLPIIYKDVKFL